MIDRNREENCLVSTPRQVLFVLFATRGNDAVAGSFREVFTCCIELLLDILGAVD